MISEGSSSTKTDLDLSSIKRGPIIIALIIGAFVAILNETFLGIAFPDLMKQFEVGASTIQWLSTVYMLIIGILVPVTAMLQQWFTTRQMFLSAMLLFLVGTIICGFSGSFPVLLIGRIIQASGTGLLIPVMMNTILIIFPPSNRGAAMGMMGLVLMFGPAIGPTLSGLIIDSLSWHWLFFLVIPLVVVSIVFGFMYLENVSDITKPKVDLLSILLSTIGFGGIVYGFSTAGEVSWSEPEVIWTIAAGFVSLILFTWRQLVVKEPMMDLRAFKYPMFALTVSLMIVMTMTLFSTALILPLYMQQAMMMTALAAGLTLMPGGIANGIMSPISGKLFDKFGPRVLIVPGLVITAVSLFLLSRVDLGTSTGVLITLHIILMIGISMIMMPAQTTGLNQLPKKLYPHGTAIMSTLQQVSGAIGTALFISIFSNGTKKYLESSSDPMAPAEAINGLVSGMQVAIQVAFFISLLALLLGFFVKRTQAPDEAQVGHDQPMH
ncbi:DHA2 family efflux MFS transporter permease subunit [Paenibacillus taichungensis]|uniref:DHA2 family efflux MFS transporter permease subunit n=1 Tax=Paenibacillus taichungensis TaxID=484184 RepID=UPI0038D0B1EA